MVNPTVRVLYFDSITLSKILQKRRLLAYSDLTLWNHGSHMEASFVFRGPARVALVSLTRA